MPGTIPNNGYLAQRIWNTSVTLFTENQCLASRLYSTSEGGVIHVEDRQGERDRGGRGSQVTFWYGDRRRGQDLKWRALGSTGFGQSDPPRPIYSQTITMAAQELATTGFVNLEIGQAYTNVPLQTKELRDCGAESAELISRQLYYHLSGITAYNSAATGAPGPCSNDVYEMDSAHQFWTNSKTSDTAVAADANSILTMEFLELVITRLQSRANGVISPLVPAQTPWGEWFIFICDGEGAEQLQRHSSTNRVTQLTLAEIQGGNDIDKVAAVMQANSGFQGTRKILVLVDEYTPFGQSGTTQGAITAGTQIPNVRRGMLLGAGAMEVIWGEGFDAESSHIKVTHHAVHEQEEWKFLTHWAGAARIPTDHATPQRMGCATVSYYVNAGTVTV